MSRLRRIRFAGVELKITTQRFIRQDPQSHTRIRLNRLLLEAALPYASAVKPNLAFFEAHGSAGVAALERLRSRLASEQLGTARRLAVAGLVLAGPMAGSAFAQTDEDARFTAFLDKAFVLTEVMKDGDAAQKGQAQQLLVKLG